MRILVTGGAGFVGSNIVRLLLDRGDEVVVMDDFSHASYKNLQDLDCECICKNILDESVYSSLGKLDAIVHEAAITDTTDPDDSKMMMVNFEGFKKVLNHSLKNDIRLVYISSAATYGDGKSPMSESQVARPLNTYAYSKLMCDREVLKIAKNKGIPPIVGIRYFNVYGPHEEHKGLSASMIYQLYLQMKADKRPRVFKFGEQKRDFIYVKDAAAATVQALELDEYALLNVGTGKARSFNDIISSINSTLSKKLEIEYFDNPYSGLYQDNTEADISELKERLGFTPKYSLEDGIRDYINSYLI